MNYKSLEESFEIPYDEEIMERLDKSKLNNEEQLHLAILSIHEYYEKNKSLPEINNLKHSNIIIDIANKIYNKLRSKEYEWIKHFDSIDRKYLEYVSRWSKCEIAPICSFLGGIASQEIFKLNGKFIPINQWLWFDFFEIISNQKDKLINIELNNSRYNDQIAIFGNEFQNKIKKLNLFIIGAGALGCEYLKNLSMMGVCCDSLNNNNSKVTITDNDNIEISNLNRQFLYNKSNVGQSKSKCASNKIKNFNIYFNCESQQLMLNDDTEDFFNEDFWLNQNFILNAVDNFEARNYIDKKCCFYSKPYIDTGTLGTIGSCFIFYPFKTQCFRDIPPIIEEQIPMCTLKDFPYKFEHCVEFAKSIFNDIFNENIKELNLLMKDFDKFHLINLSNINSEEIKLEKKDKLNVLLYLLKFYQSKQINELFKIILGIFNKYFVEKIQKLINTYPKEYKNNDGSFYWSGSRRFPKILDFNFSNDICKMYLKSSLIIFLKIFRIDYNEKYINNFDLNNYKFNEIQIMDSNNNLLDEIFDALKKVRDDLLKKMNFIPLMPEYFDKDNEKDHHLQFVHSFSILRANNYNIENYKIYQTKIISGKIIPALSSTTSSIVGYACLQLCSMILNSETKYFRCANINLANNFYDSWFPPKPKLIVDEDNDISGFCHKVLDKPFTVWDSIEIQGSLTAKEFINFFEKKYDVTIYFISCNGKKIIEPIFDKKKDYESIKNKYNLYIEELYKKSSLKSSNNKKIFELRITCKRKKFLISCPLIKYFIKNK